MKRASLVLTVGVLAALAAGYAWADQTVIFRDAQTATGPQWLIQRNAANPLNFDCESSCAAWDTARTVRSKPKPVRSRNQVTRQACLLDLDAQCTAAYALDAGVQD